MSNRAFHLLLTMSIVAGLVAFFAPRAHAAPPAPTPAPESEFDRGAELLIKDPFASKSAFASAAAGFERQLAFPLSQFDRARALYNLGVSRQLGGNPAAAVLAFRRADLLAPAIPGLAEHLAAARAGAKGEPAPDSRGRDVDAVALARDWTLSIPRIWLWRAAIAAYSVFWGLVLLRVLLPRSPWRPPASLVLAVAVAGIAPAALLVVMDRRERNAASEAVVLTEATARLQPDDLIGQASPTGVLKPGIEVSILEERIGGNGQPWLRVRPLGAPDLVEESAAWIPEPSVERIAPPRD